MGTVRKTLMRTWLKIVRQMVKIIGKLKDQKD